MTQSVKDAATIGGAVLVLALWLAHEWWIGGFDGK